MRLAPPLAALALAGATLAAEPPLGPVAWRRLELGASKLLLSASTVVTVEQLESSALGSTLRTPPEGTAVPAPGRGVLVLRLDSHLPFGRRERTTVWMDPASGAALQGHKLVTGRKPYEKLFRYTREGFYFWRAAPASSAEESTGPEQWSRRRDRLVRATPPLPEGAVVVDSYALLYLASAARLERPNAELRVLLLAEEQPVELRFASGRLVQARLDYRERGTDGGRRQNREVLQRVVTVTAHRPGVAAARDEIDLGFLGMRGGVNIFLDAASGLPLLLQGRADTIGDLTVRLAAVEWAGPLPAAPGRGSRGAP
ncbi:MAG TPA: hypothetical protein P5234_15740 [Thermoanaerobaculaceae bacterium]|nr:hypothetical protein [Thermoanaerobaculaceae bacterium]HRS17688.1 hypothetical protein [Thermoanaerobaculaceae bacterium]